MNLSPKSGMHQWRIQDVRVNAKTGCVENGMPKMFEQPFSKERVKLRSGGSFEFDAVSADKTLVANISTSGARTASGKHAVGKKMKLRPDIYFLLLTEASRKLIILCEADMHALCKREYDAGRIPKEIEFFHVALPATLASKLVVARKISSEEVSPLRNR